MGENIALVERYFTAFGAGDVDAALDCVHPEAIWHIDGDPAVVTVGIIQGRDRVRRWLERFPTGFRPLAFSVERMTDAALVMVEKMVGALFRRADRTRSDRLLGQARMLKDTARFHARLGHLLVDARASGRDAFHAIDAKMGWDRAAFGWTAAEPIGRSTTISCQYPPSRRCARPAIYAWPYRPTFPNGMRNAAPC